MPDLQGLGAATGSAFGPFGSLIGGGLGALAGGLFSGASNPEDLWRQYLSQLPSYETLLSAGQSQPSAFGSIAEDPTLRAAQMNALRQMQNESNRQGLTAEDQAAQLQAANQANQHNRSMRDAALQEMAMRGQGSASQELATRLQGQQTDANSMALASSQNAANARQRALQAMGASGSMASNVRGQDWSNAAQRAQATDTINQFNAANRLNAYGLRMGALGQGFAGMAGGSNEQYQRGVGQGAAAGAGLGGAAQYFGTRGGSNAGINPGSYYQPSDFQLKSSWPGGY